jgi:hypothetical protein
MALTRKHLAPCQVGGCKEDSDGDATPVLIPGGLSVLVFLCNRHRDQYRAAAVS